MDKKVKEEIEKMRSVFKSLQLISPEGKTVYELAKAYLKDAEYFLEKGDLYRALEAVSISWAYIDAGLHLGVFKLPEKLKKTFTV